MILGFKPMNFLKIFKKRKKYLRIEINLDSTCWVLITKSKIDVIFDHLKFSMERDIAPEFDLEVEAVYRSVRWTKLEQFAPIRLIFDNFNEVEYVENDLNDSCRSLLKEGLEHLWKEKYPNVSFNLDLMLLLQEKS